MNQNENDKGATITTKDFMLLFACTNILQGNFFVIKKELLSFIEDCKSNDRFSNILCNVNTLESSINQLINDGICRPYPKDNEESYIIFNNIPTLELIKLIRENIDYLEEMIEFIKQFNQYRETPLEERNNSNKTYMDQLRELTKPY